MATQTWDVGDEAGFMACYRSTFAEVYRYAGTLCGGDRATAEDLVQDVYLAALAKARDGDVRELGTGWFVVALRHRFIDRLRAAERERRRLRLVSSSAGEARSGSAVPSQLARLPERERAVLVMRFVDDLTVPQIAHAMGMSTHAAESLVARAMHRVRQQEVRDG